MQSVRASVQGSARRTIIVLPEISIEKTSDARHPAPFRKLDTGKTKSIPLGDVEFFIRKLLIELATLAEASGALGSVAE